MLFTSVSQGHVLHPAVLPGKNVGDLPVDRIGGGDKQGGHHIPEIAHVQAHHLLHILAQGGGGIQRHHAVPQVVQLHPVLRCADGVHGVALGALRPAGGAQYQNLLLPVPVDVVHPEAAVLFAQQLHHLIAVDGVGRQGVGLPRRLPVHDDLLGGAVVQILVRDRVDGVARALDDGGHLIVLLHLPVDVDLQGPLIGAHPEEGDGLLHAIAVQILELHLLGQLPGQGRGVLAAGIEHLVDPLVQLEVVVRRPRGAVELVHRLGKAAAQQQRQQPCRQQQLESSHVAAPSVGKVYQSFFIIPHFPAEWYAYFRFSPRPRRRAGRPARFFLTISAFDIIISTGDIVN